MSRRARAVALAVALALGVAGCGGDSGGAGGSGGSGAGGDRKRSDRLVDFSLKPPFINSLEIDPADGSFLLATNRGFFKIDRESKQVTQIKGKLTAEGKITPVGTFLAVTAVGPGRFIGSGHPDDPNAGLPQFLGFLRSDDDGKSWQVLARLGEADLHKLIKRGNRIYAFDAVIGAMLITDDGGRNFSERFTPRGLVIDFVVDPEDRDYLLAATEEQLFRSEDAGQKWRPLEPGRGIRLSWEAGGPVYRADMDGTIKTSTDRGATWQTVGKAPGEPYKFKQVGPQELFLALSDGTIVETTDGGRSWRAVFEP